MFVHFSKSAAQVIALKCGDEAISCIALPKSMSLLVQAAKDREFFGTIFWHWKGRDQFGPNLPRLDFRHKMIGATRTQSKKGALWESGINIRRRLPKSMYSGLQQGWVATETRLR